MYINTNSIIINGVVMGEYITQAQFGFNKLWGDDAGRNLNGDFSGSLIGIFPKIILQFQPLTKEQLEVITPILDSARQTVTYYDPFKKANVTMTTYTGDYEVINKNIISGSSKNEGFSCSFISVSKRS